MSDDDFAATDLRQLHGLLGNETRMRIMRVLWDEFDFSEYVTEEQDGVAFSTLRERTEVEDPGNFNYHLGELAGTLVENAGDGYVLTPLGYNLMRALDQYASFEYETIDEWVVDDPCPFCDGDLAAQYRREILEVRCRDCGALSDGGNFTFVQLSSTGTRHLSRHELLDAATLVMASKVRSSMHGVCWDCHAPMDLEFTVCEEHEPSERSGNCPSCLHRYQTKVTASCPTCGTGGYGPTLEYAIVSQLVGAFFAGANHGPEQIGPWRYRLTALASATETLVSTEPVIVEITLSFDGDTCRVTLEEESSRIVVTHSSG